MLEYVVTMRVTDDCKPEKLPVDLLKKYITPTDLFAGLTVEVISINLQKVVGAKREDKKKKDKP